MQHQVYTDDGVHQTDLWMESRPSFSSWPHLKSSSVGTDGEMCVEDMSCEADVVPNMGRCPSLTKRPSNNDRMLPIKKRRSLRKSLVKYICQQQGEEDDDPSKSDFEKKYYHYIQNGINLEHLTPLQDSWVKNIMGKVPGHLKSQNETLNALLDEVKDDYLLSIKTAILKYTFCDPEEADEESVKDLPLHRLELVRVPKGWKDSFLISQKRMNNWLHSFNTTMQQVLNLWNTTYRDLRLIDTAELQSRTESMELSAFQQNANGQIGNVRGTLLNKWLPEVHNIYYHGSRRKLVPAQSQMEKLQSFFNCAATLMAIQLQNLVLDSMSDYTRFLCPNPDSETAFGHSGFVLFLILEDREITLEPDLKSFEDVLLNIYEFMLRSVTMLPRVETKLYAEWSSSSGETLKPVILPEIVQAQQDEVCRVINTEYVKPVAYIHEYDKYATLVNKEAEEAMERFLGEEHTFQELMNEVITYQQLIDRIQYTSRKVVTLGMFEVQSHKLIQALVKRARDLQQKLVSRMLQGHQDINTALCNEFEKIAERALSTPPDTHSLMELKAFVNKVKTSDLPELEQRLSNSNMQLCSLIDFVSLSPADMELNRKTIQWLRRLPTIFEEHDQIVSEKTTQYQNSLKVYSSSLFCLQKPLIVNDCCQSSLPQLSLSEIRAHTNKQLLELTFIPTGNTKSSMSISHIILEFLEEIKSSWRKF